MRTGIIKWFDPVKNFGFITPTGGGPDLFMHGSKLEAAKIPVVNVGDTVSYEECSKAGKLYADKLVLVSTAAEDSIRAVSEKKRKPPMAEKRPSSGSDPSLDAFEREWGLRPSP